MNTRRQFVLGFIPAGALLLGAATFISAEASHLEESDPQATSLGYKQDATEVDVAKYPVYAAGRNCSGCQRYQGRAGEAWGPCPIMGGKLVNAQGWCLAWIKV